MRHSGGDGGMGGGASDERLGPWLRALLPYTADKKKFRYPPLLQSTEFFPLLTGAPFASLRLKLKASRDSTSQLTITRVRSEVTVSVVLLPRLVHQHRMFLEAIEAAEALNKNSLPLNPPFFAVREPKDKATVGTDTTTEADAEATEAAIAEAETDTGGGVSGDLVSVGMALPSFAASVRREVRDGRRGKAYIRAEIRLWLEGEEEGEEGEEEKEEGQQDAHFAGEEEEKREEIVHVLVRVTEPLLPTVRPLLHTYTAWLETRGLETLGTGAHNTHNGSAALQVAVLQSFSYGVAPPPIGTAPHDTTSGAEVVSERLEKLEQLEPGTMWPTQRWALWVPVPISTIQRGQSKSRKSRKEATIVVLHTRQHLLIQPVHREGHSPDASRGRDLPPIHVLVGPVRAGMAEGACKEQMLDAGTYVLESGTEAETEEGGHPNLNPSQGRNPDRTTGLCTTLLLSLPPPTCPSSNPSNTQEVLLSARGGLVAAYALPDFSMPFNVLTLVSTMLAFLFGSMVNALFHREREAVKEAVKKEKEDKEILKEKEKVKEE